MAERLFRNKRPTKVYKYIDGKRTQGKALRKISPEQRMVNAIREVLGLSDLYQQGESRATEQFCNWDVWG